MILTKRLLDQILKSEAVGQYYCLSENHLFIIVFHHWHWNVNIFPIFTHMRKIAMFG
jgi:hypothetical protein